MCWDLFSEARVSLWVVWLSDIRGHSRPFHFAQTSEFAHGPFSSLPLPSDILCAKLYSWHQRSEGAMNNLGRLRIRLPPIGDHLDFQKSARSDLFGLKKLAPLTKLVRLTCSRSSDHLILAFWVVAYRRFGCIIVFRFKKYHWGFWHRCLLEPIGRGTASFR